MSSDTATAQLSAESQSLALGTEPGLDTMAHIDSEKPTSFEPSIAATDKTPSVASIESLPNELLTNIFGYFDTPKPSGFVLQDEPVFELTHSEVTDLKSMSCVSNRWRQATLPVLFKFARFIVAESKSQRPIISEVMAPFLTFVKSNSLRKVIASFTFLIRDKNITHTSDGGARLNSFSEFWYSLFKIIDPVDLLIVAPPEALGALTACRIHTEDAWCFSDCHCHYLHLQRSPTSVLDSPSIEVLALEEHSTAGQTSETLKSTAENLSISNTPDALPHPAEEVLSTASFYEDKESTPEGNRRDLLQAEASSSASSSASGISKPRVPARALSSALFDVRPWTTLLLNEGSSIQAYCTDKFWLRKQPSILPDLCGSDEATIKTFISPTIKTMNYIAIFPLQTHFAALVDNLPSLDRVYVQLVPHKNVLDDPERMADVEHTDLWMERNNCYAHMVRELFGAPPTRNYKYLQQFESGDSADQDAWLMAVEYVKRAGNWNVAGEGIFSRNSEDMVPENPEGGIEGNSTFEGSLILWKWNGVTKLPISALPLYDRPFGLGF
ncbi:hypothetical protein LOCC1_G007745 [Lachnellula occidentalis]|uniref:F-box domain-containing protein n=1 Tax=Lachnellula occidentalis TaxID=215460 RepID=A0A8H8RDG4_9HELO|nr:hypothetical protein LOCC1_G007745 [Lachnellula occidentalis]